MSSQKCRQWNSCRQEDLPVSPSNFWNGLEFDKFIFGSGDVLHSWTLAMQGLHAGKSQAYNVATFVNFCIYLFTKIKYVGKR